MREMIKTIQVVGPRRMFKLARAYRVGWQGILSGYFTTRTLQALFNVGFFDALQKQGRINVADFARSQNLDASILQTLCDSLYALSILDQKGADYVLDSKGKVLVEVARGWFEGVYGYEDLYHNLEGMLRKENTYGEDVHRRSADIARGSGEMEKWIYFPLVAHTIAQKGYKRVLDLGCGDATFLRELCTQNRYVIAYGIDIAPEAIAEGQEKVEQAGLQHRIHLSVHDISKIEQAPAELQNVDVATIFFILHELRYRGPECVVDFLRDYRRLFPNVPLIVFEVTKPSLEERRQRPGMAVHYILQHELSHQTLVSREEWISLFKEAGFTSIEEQLLDFARTGIFTLR